MPKKSKAKFANNRAERQGNKYVGAEIFRNEAAVYDDTEPRESLQRFLEMFRGKIDDNVISMVYSECFPDVDQCLESLLNLSCEDNTHQVDENTSSLNNESEKSTNPTDTSMPHSWLPDNTTKISEVSETSADEDGNTKLFENDGYRIAQDYDYFQTPSDMNFVETEACLLSSVPNSFQYNSCFQPVYNSQMYPPLGFQYNPGFPNYHYNPVPQNAPNYEIKSYASQIKNNCNLPKSNPLVSFPSKATSPKNSRNGFKWNNSDEVKNAIEKIKIGCHLLIILRGLPGSGKSTLAKKLKFSGVVLTTDDYFYKHGKFKFDPSLLDEAHYWNQNRAREALMNNVSPVIIDNTNTEAWEMLPYIKLGKKFNYEIVILEPSTPWKFRAKELAFRNQHGVRKEKITKMLARYQHNITLDHFDSALSTPVIEGAPAIQKKSDDNCNLFPARVKAENQKPYVSLEAVVHQEEQPSDILEDKEPISSLPKNFASKEFPLPANVLVINECSDTESFIEAMNDINENIKIDNLEELKSLAHEDSEDSQSLGKNDALASDQELTSWEEITEHDDDFLWKTSSSHDVSSQFHCNTLIENIEELETTNQSHIDPIEEKQFICLQNSIQCNESSDISCLPAPDVISIAEPISLRNNLHSLVDVLPKNEECTSLESLNSCMANIHIDSDVKSSECITDINPDELLPKKLNCRKAEKKSLISHNSEIKRNFDHKTLSKLNDLNNFTVPSNHQLCKHKSTKSFDESYAFRDAKTKNDKSSETNLLRSKFSSVPVLGNQLNISSEKFSNDLTKDTKHNSYNEILFIKTEVDIKKENSSSDLTSYASPDCENSWVNRKNSLKSICSNDKLFIANKLEIPDENFGSKTALYINDLKNPSSWEGSENHLINEDSMVELSDYSIIKSPFNANDRVNQEQGIEKESNNVPNFIDPKPPRGEKIANMIFRKNINENKLSESSSTHQENFANMEQFEEWDYSTEPVAKFEDEDNLVSNKALFTPKPPRNFSQAIHTPDKLPSSKNDVEVNGSPECSTPVKYKNKQRSPLFKNALQYMSKDWTFPQFIQNQVHTDNLDTENPVLKTNSDTQTELKDFILINKIERNEACTSEYCIIEPSNIGEWVKNDLELKKFDDSDIYVPRFAMLEKSTSTEDLKPNIEISEKLARLNECFPHISDEDLNHLMGLCDNDEMWVINLLLDSEYNPCSKETTSIQCKNSDQDNSLTSSSTSCEYNLKDIGFKIFNKSSKQFEDETPTLRENLDCEYKNSNSNSTTGSDSASDEGQMEINIDSNCMTLNSNPLQNLHLSLDPVFAMQLEELFGPVISDGSASTESCNTVVEIDLEFARLIHSKWKSSVLNKGQSDTENVDTKTKKMGVKLAGEKNKKEQKNLNVVKKNTSEPMSLSEIMEMEQAVEHHKQEKLRKDRDIVTKKNRNKLYSMFPGADPTTLDEIFESNNCCFETSLKALEEDVGNSKTSGYGNLTLKECEGYAEILNESIDNWNKPNSTSDFASFECYDWTRDGEIDYSENNIKTTKVTPSTSTITPEAEALRGKAVEHYLMRQKCIEKASCYYQRGMKPVASVYAQDASEHRRKSKEANKAASTLIAEQRNANLGNLSLDLHGLYVQEAIPMLDKFLKDRKLEVQRRPPGPLTKLTIITGQGHHSQRGPKIRPSVIEYLRRSGYFYSENHAGILEVYINSDGSSAPRSIPKDVGYNID